MSENKIALSVVIPVYNAERTLPEALDSLLARGFEIMSGWPECYWLR